MQCSICLEDLDEGPTLACGHSFHASCLARLAGAAGTRPTRRGALTACPNCRAVSRVAITPVAEPAPARTARRTAAVVTPREAQPVMASPPAPLLRAPTPSTRRAHTRSSGPPPPPPPRVSGPPLAPRAIVPRARPRAGRVPQPPVSRPHVASTTSAWVAVCTDLLEAAKDCTNMGGLREPLVSRGFCCGSDRLSDGAFTVTVPPGFPCYYDVVGKDYANRDRAQSLIQLRKYLESALALARSGDAYRTDAECRDARVSTLVSAQTSRFTGVRRERDRWRATIRMQGSDIPLGKFDNEEDAARAYDAAVFKYKLQGNCRYTINFPGEAPLASVLAALPDAAPPRRSGRAPVPKRKVEAPGPALRCERGLPIERNKQYTTKSVEGAYKKSNGKWTCPKEFPGREFDDLDAYRAAKKQRKERRDAYSERRDGATRIGRW